MWSEWRQRFESNRRRPEPAVEVGNEAIPSEWVDVLASSLARFQAGETGEGRVVHQVRQTRWSSIDDDYREALRLFVAEEGRHARLLGRAVKALGGRPVQKAWTERAFRMGRSAVGVRTKLVVLWAAEVGAVVGYGALVARLPPSGIAATLQQLVEDERGHLAFHTTFFRAAASDPATRAVAVAALGGAVAAALTAMWWDHRELWQTLGISKEELARGALAKYRETVAMLGGPAVDPLATGVSTGGRAGAALLKRVA
jgi:hypothetical protein